MIIIHAKTKCLVCNSNTVVQNTCSFSAGVQAAGKIRCKIQQQCQNVCHNVQTNLSNVQNQFVEICDMDRVYFRMRSMHLHAVRLKNYAFLRPSVCTAIHFHHGSTHSIYTCNKA